MKRQKIRSLFILLLAVVMIAAAGLPAYAYIPGSKLMQQGYEVFRDAADYAFANPEYVSGAGTNLLSDGKYYNLIESDYYKAHKDEELAKAWKEYQEKYETWRDAPQNAATEEQKAKRLDSMVFDENGVFKGFKDDYTNPEKTVYLTVIAATAEAARKTAAAEGVTLIYDAEDSPCAVIRFTGSETIFNGIINDPDVLFIAPAFGISISPYGYISILCIYGRLNKTPEEARDILRYSVGLPIEYETDPDWAIDTFSRQIKTSEKWFFIASDLNFDGHVTAEDARLALRIAVDLDPAPSLDTDV